MGDSAPTVRGSAVVGACAAGARGAGGRRSAIDAAARSALAPLRSASFPHLYETVRCRWTRASPVRSARASYSHVLFICYRCIVSRCAPYWADRQHGRYTGSTRRSHGTGRRDGRRAQYAL